MIVQQMDEEDSVFAFIPGWVKLFRNYLEKLYVLALKRGNFKALENVEVYTLGKERGGNKFSYVFNLYRTVLPLLRKKAIDGIFVFQGGFYPFLLWPLKKIYKFKLIQWKVHSVIDLEMKLNMKAVDRVVTAASTCFGEGFPKVKIMSHGIDTGTFYNISNTPRRDVIAVIGRITPIKSLERALDVFSRLISIEEFSHVTLEFYGVTLNDRDRNYLRTLKKIIAEKKIMDKVEFKGKVPYTKLPGIYSSCRLTLSMGSVGSLDKVILESMACETPVIMATHSIKEQLGPLDDLLYVGGKGPVLEQVKEIFRMAPERYDQLGKDLREIVIGHHSLDSLLERISNEFKVV